MGALVQESKLVGTNTADAEKDVIGAQSFSQVSATKADMLGSLHKQASQTDLDPLRLCMELASLIAETATLQNGLNQVSLHEFSAEQISRLNQTSTKLNQFCISQLRNESDFATLYKFIEETNKLLGFNEPPDFKLPDAKTMKGQYSHVISSLFSEWREARDADNDKHPSKLSEDLKELLEFKRECERFMDNCIRTPPSMLRGNPTYQAKVISVNWDEIADDPIKICRQWNEILEQMQPSIGTVVLTEADKQELKPIEVELIRISNLIKELTEIKKRSDEVNSL